MFHQYVDSFIRLVIGDSNDEINSPRQLSLTDAQVLRLRKVYAKGSSANMKLSKT